MADPLSEVITLLRPRAPFSKIGEASGPFRVRRDDVNEAFYCLVLMGRLNLEVDGKAPVILSAGDFALLPAVGGLTVTSLDPPPPPGYFSQPVYGEDGVVRVGMLDPRETPPQVQQLVGHCSFGSPDAELLVSLLPEMVVVRGEDRLASLAALVRDEARADRPARDVVLENLLQVLLIEAFRSSVQSTASTGLLSGLADARVAPALRAMHGAPQQAWSIRALAGEAGLPLRVHYPFQPHCRPAANELPAQLAHDASQAHAALRPPQHRRDFQPDRLWLHQRLQHSLYPARWLPARQIRQGRCYKLMQRRPLTISQLGITRQAIIRN